VNATELVTCFVQSSVSISGARACSNVPTIARLSEGVEMLVLTSREFKSHLDAS
jgi:hypothetical protein